MIASPPPWYPSRLECRRANAGNYHLPGDRPPARLNKTKPGGVGQQVAQGDGFFAAGSKLRDVPAHPVIQIKLPLLPELPDSHRSHRLHRGEPEHNRLAGHRQAVACLTDAAVGHGGARQRDIELRPQMQVLVNPLRDQGNGAGEGGLRRLHNGSLSHSDSTGVIVPHWRGDDGGQPG